MATVAAAAPPKVYAFEEVKAALARIPPSEIIDAMAEGFVSYSKGQVSVPPPQTLGAQPLAPFSGHPEAQACIKSAYENGGEIFVTKIASGGGGSNSGMVLIFSQRSFRPEAILLDEGWLTEVRTAAAGALAARCFATQQEAGGGETLKCIGVIGAGVQAKFQLEMLATVTPCRHVKVWARTLDKARQLSEDLRRDGWNIEVVESAEEACITAGLVLTTTPSRSPIVQEAWLRGRPVLVTAIGADATGKQELHTDVLKEADLIVVDSLQQCQERGELQHVVRKGSEVALKSSAAVEFGAWLSQASNRRSSSGLVVFDATGVAVQDVRIAELVLNQLCSANAAASL